ncbi:hypothetical protein BGW37DRAFT_430958 [Umbelopsis sp. PMI_123]|nr:hypothetical protein BGW37DRAFT_430958 [Umbelopsis sp. PMI_123]
MTGPNIRHTQGSLNHEQLVELRSLFKSFDRNHDGSISREELYSVLSSMNMPPSKEQLDAMVNAQQLYIIHPASFDMFCSIMLPTFNEQGEERTVDQELMEAFKAFDKDGNGYISATELKSMMRSLGDRVSDEDVQKIIAEVDVNGDGMVSYEEYLTMMRPNNKNRSNDIKRKKEKNRKSLLNVKGWFHKSKREK